MEEFKNENDYKRSTERSPSPGVKSTAVVKYTAFQSPVEYSRLQCNTDLNLPPSNWGSIDSYGLKQILTRGTGLSSFRMAHMFPDCVGEVDVISDAECIKRLLKLPYHPSGTVSMMVHRVENTLLLDDFDVYDYLMKSEWSWLKDFFYENILKTMSEQERMALVPVPSPAMQLTHKFLSHSVAQPSSPPPLTAPALPHTDPFLPEPETRPEELSNEHHYNRNVLWTFEDIHMLVGSNLPIFGDKDRPCVSLRLRDARDPINVLTGIDYWLDNLMCNVPEVLMCYHLDGIVQKYEPMKTEELPHMENSRFSPKVIRNVAQNILSFLKSNATKAGHTYWLFKGPHDDVVKLYDLTSLCPDSLDNPFTTPVAMLLYRVARNMRLMNKSRHVRQLLEHVVELLEVERYPQIVASSHYMLSDLYVPATTNPARPDFRDESSDPDEESEFDNYTEFGSERDDATTEKDGNNTSEKDDGSDRVEDLSDYTEKEDTCDKKATDVVEAVCETESDGEANKCERDGDSSLALQIGGLTLKNTDYRTQFHANEGESTGRGAQSLGSDPLKRCGRALRHALEGLRALHHLTIHKSKEEERERLKQQIIAEEQHPKMANPYEPIKMHYEPLNKKKDTSQIQKEHVSRSRRRKRDRKTTAKTKDVLRETDTTIDKNAILSRKDNKSLPSWHEPNRDDNFAWKLHLKTLIYEKICLTYATLAEYCYANEQYGFSIKYISLASKCQKLLSNMIIKSRVVDASCLIGRIGDIFFQLTTHWSSLDKFKKQFETDHEIDSQIRVEMENDFAEEMEKDFGEEFDLDISLPCDITEAMLASCSFYRRAMAAAWGSESKRDEVLRRLASVSNELAVRYMYDCQQMYSKYTETQDKEEASGYLQQFKVLSNKAAEYLDEAAAIFQRLNDVTNLALLYCNKVRYLRMKAHCDEGGFTWQNWYSSPGEVPSPPSQPAVKQVLYQCHVLVFQLGRVDAGHTLFEATISALMSSNASTCNLSLEKRALYNQGKDLYYKALKLLGPKESCLTASIRDLVCWELSSHLYTRASLMQDNPGIDAGDVPEIMEALKQALKHCNLSSGPRQHLYQFRAALIYHRLGSLYHAQYSTTKEDGIRRRALFNATCTYYERATLQFAALEEAVMFFNVRLEHVAALEAHAAVSPSVKLKLLQTALELLRQCHSIMKVLKERDSEEQKDTPHPEESEKKTPGRELDLLCLYEERLHFFLKSIIQYCKSKSNKDYEKITDMYKKFYCVSLKIKKSENVRSYAASICEVLTAMDEISREFA